MICLGCGEALKEPRASRLQQGGISYRKSGVLFIPDYFEDGDLIKWLCASCTEGHNVNARILQIDMCSLCGHTYQPVEELASETVIKFEEGPLRKSKKGAHRVLIPDVCGHAHFMCLIDEWNIPLINLERMDTPDAEDTGMRAL